MKKLRRLVFFIHLALGIGTGLVGALMAGTAVVMAFADSYLDVREYRSRTVNPFTEEQTLSLEALAERVAAAHPEESISRIGLDLHAHHAYEFYLGKTGLAYVNPVSGDIVLSDVVPLRKALHKGVEQWHRFFGLSGDSAKTGKQYASWFNVALIPLLLSGFVLWWPKSFRWRSIQTGLLPIGKDRARGTERSWHTALGFWALPFLLIMVVTGSMHSFEWVRDTAQRIIGPGNAKPRAHDSLWAPGLSRQAIPTERQRLTLDELRDQADRELTGWTRLDIFPATDPKSENKTGTTSLVAKTPGWGPSFFPVVLQVHPYSGEILDTHSWDDLSRGTRLLAWNRWLHKGEALGRIGQIIAGLACIVMLVLIYTGWALAIRRLFRRLRGGQPQKES